MVDFYKNDPGSNMPDDESANRKGLKKVFVEPEIKEFDDLEKQIKSPLIGTFTP
jgi:hypothetical protein